MNSETIITCLSGFYLQLDIQIRNSKHKYYLLLLFNSAIILLIEQKK